MKKKQHKNYKNRSKNAIATHLKLLNSDVGNPGPCWEQTQPSINVWVLSMKNTIAIKYLILKCVNNVFLKL
jgi:hypothetical protein